MFAAATGGPYLCVTTYSTQDLTRYADEIVDLVLAGQELSSKHRFLKIYGVERSMDRFGRFTQRGYKATQRGVARLRKEIAAGRILTIAGHEVKEFHDTWGEISLQIDITHAVDLSKTVNTCIFTLNSDFLSETPNSLDRFIDFSKRTFLVTRSLYGYITVGTDFWHLWSAAVGNPGGVSKEEENEVLGWQMRQRMIQKNVRGAYWGNFLGENHVQALKGVDNIREHLDFCRVQELGDGSVLALLSDDPLQVLSGDLQDRLDKLSVFLRPITLPPYEPPKLDEREMERREREYLEKEVAPEGVRARNLEAIHRMVEVCVERFRSEGIGVLDLTPESLKLLDDYLTPELCRKALRDERLFLRIVQEFGSYFGEVLIKNLGGAWLVREPYWDSSVYVNHGELAAFSIVVKRIDEGRPLQPVFRGLKEIVEEDRSIE